MNTEKKNPRDAVIVAAGRSAMAKAFKGSFAETHPIEYGAQVLKGVLTKLDHFDPALIDDVIVGCAFPEKRMGYNAAKLIVQRAGLPDSVCAQTINRFCSSGLQSIATAANAIKAGDMDIIVAGGCEQMTGMNMVDPDIEIDEKLMEENPDAYIIMGETAELVAEKYNRKIRNPYDLEPEEEALIGRYFKEEYDADFVFVTHYPSKKRPFYAIIPVTTTFQGKEITVTKDEGIRPGTSMESLATLKPCFRENGRVTAATSSQMTDGTGFVVMMARETAEKLGYTPIARFVSFAVGGVPANVMGIGPIVAVPKALKKANLTLDDISVVELNEAFASQALACIKTLEIPMEKANPNGGAMALGHPLGATGAFLTCKVLSELKRRNEKYGMVTMCIGGGMGAAGIFEMES